jgi:hypothetical protein
VWLDIDGDVFHWKVLMEVMSKVKDPRARYVVQVVECLPLMGKALSLNPTTTKKRERKTEPESIDSYSCEEERECANVP